LDRFFSLKKICFESHSRGDDVYNLLK
jgi:hypothetical protein